MVVFPTLGLGQPGAALRDLVSFGGKTSVPCGTVQCLTPRVNSGAIARPYRTTRDAARVSKGQRRRAVPPLEGSVEGRGLGVGMATVHAGAARPLENKAVLVDPKGGVVFSYLSRPVPGWEASIIQVGDGRLPVADTTIGRIGAAAYFKADRPQFVRQIGVAGPGCGRCRPTTGSESSAAPFRWRCSGQSRTAHRCCAPAARGSRSSMRTWRNRSTCTAQPFFDSPPGRLTCIIVLVQ